MTEQVLDLLERYASAVYVSGRLSLEVVEPKVPQLTFLDVAAKHGRDAVVCIALAVVAMHEGLMHDGFRQALVRAAKVH